MKRHIQDFNRFSVNEMITGSVPPPKGFAGGKQKRKFFMDLNLVRGHNDPSNEVTPEMTFKFLQALQDNDVLLSVEEWFGPGGGATSISLYGTKSDVQSAFMQGLGDDAEWYIEDLEGGAYDAE